MKNNLDLNDFDHPENEIDIKELLNILWVGKKIIIASTTVFSILAILYSLQLPNIYSSTALLSPAGQETSAGSMGGIGGLANLAGISLSAQSTGNSTKALTKVKTISFYKENILPNIFLPDLVALESWDSQNNIISYASNKYYDAESKTILKTASPQKTYKKFMKIVDISNDKKNGFITISIKHQSPYVAKKWTELIVDQINQFFRNQDKLQAEASINFLNAQMAQTSYTEIKNIIAELLKQELQKLSLIEANNFYVFSYLDPPIVKEKKSEPERSSISILGAVLGFMLGLLIVLISNFFRTKK